jgi:hypothetical protein
MQFAAARIVVEKVFFFGGEQTMKRSVITWALAVALFGLAPVTEAVKPVTRPFVHVSATPSSLDLGTTSFAGLHESPAALTVVVESNCIHGPILMSTTALKRRQGGSIPPEHIFVKTPATGEFVGMARPVAISQPTTGPHKIVVDLKVQTEWNLAGEYKGTITLTVMPPS